MMHCETDQLICEEWYETVLFNKNVHKNNSELCISIITMQELYDLT